MEAKDTVIIKSTHCNQYCHKEQAEISFKAGRESLLTELNSPSNLILAARQEGIKEVVDWINEQIAEMDRTGYYPKREMWQAFVKGLKIDEIRG